jgi:YD repeat-containing protein
LLGTLAKIVHPTGGHTYYEYELHQPDYVVDATIDSESGLKDVVKKPGGMRIKSINKFDMDNNLLLSKTFEYELGIANGEPQYFWTNTFPERVENCTLVIHKFSSHNISSLSITNTPSPIVYSKVTEKTEGHGKTIHYFRSFMDHPELYTQEELNSGMHLHLDLNIFPSSPFTTKRPPVIGQQNFRGKLIAKLYLKEGDFQPIKEEYYDYSNSLAPVAYVSMTDYVDAERIYYNSPIFENTSLFRLYYEYPFYLPTLHLSKKRIIDRSSNGTIETVSHYNYNKYGQLSIESFHGNKIIRTEYLYSGDYDNFKYANSLPILDDMKNANLLSFPVEKRIYIGENRYLIDGEYQEYQDIGGGKYYPDVTYKLNFTSPQLANNFEDSFSDYIRLNGVLFPGLKKEINTVYDPNGNLLEATTMNSITISYFWAYNNSLPVVKAENISNSDLLTNVDSAAVKAGLDTNTWISDPVEEKVKWQNFNNLLRTYCGKNVIVTTFTYKPLTGLTSMTDANGITTYYEYDDFGRLKLIRDNDWNILKAHDYHYALDQIVD